MTPMTGNNEGWPQSVRNLLYVAMALFLVTLAIGVINGLDLYEFNRDQLLTHVHSGTLGWVTLGLVAAASWMFQAADRRLALALVILIPVYVVAFYWGNLPARAITGVALLAAIVWLVGWAWGAYRRVGSLPGLAVALGLLTFGYGSVIGVLLQVQLASGTSLFPEGADIIGAHGATMTFSYLILVAMGVLEWRIKRTAGYPLLGVIQYVALFAGGGLLAAAMLFFPTQVTSIGGIYLLLELIAIVLFAVRILPAAVRTDWMSASGARIQATAAIFVVIAMAIYMYLVASFLADPTQPFEDFFPILVASDHASFVGVVTNVILMLALALTADQGEDTGLAGQAGYWLMNVGLIVFLVGLAGEMPEVKRIGAPVMGTGILIELAIVAMRLRASDLRAAKAT